MCVYQFICDLMLIYNVSLILNQVHTPISAYGLTKTMKNMATDWDMQCNVGWRDPPILFLALQSRTDDSTRAEPDWVVSIQTEQSSAHRSGVFRQNKTKQAVLTLTIKPSLNAHDCSTEIPLTILGITKM